MDPKSFTGEWLYFSLTCRIAINACGMAKMIPKGAHCMHVYGNRANSLYRSYKYHAKYLHNSQ